MSWIVATTATTNLLPPGPPPWHPVSYRWHLIGEIAIGVVLVILFMLPIVVRRH